MIQIQVENTKAAPRLSASPREPHMLVPRCLLLFVAGPSRSDQKKPTSPVPRKTPSRPYVPPQAKPPFPGTLSFLDPSLLTAELCEGKHGKRSGVSPVSDTDPARWYDRGRTLLLLLLEALVQQPDGSLDPLGRASDSHKLSSEKRTRSAQRPANLVRQVSADLRARTGSHRVLGLLPALKS